MNQMHHNRNYFFISLFVFLTSIVACTSSTKTQTNSMSARQKMLKSFYPTLTKITHFFGVKNRVIESDKLISPQSSIYDIPIELINGDKINLAQWKGKKIVIANTASDCGYTAQYEELQSLYSKEAGDLIIIGFPANDFKKQEKGSNEEIAAFCKKNYGVEFPIAMKTVVIKGKEQHPLFQWLSDPTKNGWNKEAPSWNFSKYLIDEEGRLVGYYDPGVSPLGTEITNAIGN
jgi:glutathione peroxidase